MSKDNNKSIYQPRSKLCKLLVEVISTYAAYLDKSTDRETIKQDIYNELQKRQVKNPKRI
jgi:hypothetical protein